MAWKIFSWTNGKARLADENDNVLTGPDGKPVEIDAPAPTDAAVSKAAPAAVPAALDLENNPLIKSLLARVEAAELKATAAEKDLASEKIQREAERIVNRNKEAKLFAARYIGKDKPILPAGEEKLVNLYNTAAEDDFKAPVPEGQASRVQQLEAVLAALPAADLTLRAFGRAPLPSQQFALPNDRDDESKTTDQDEIFRLTAATDAGVEALKATAEGRAWLAKNKPGLTYDAAH